MRVFCVYDGILPSTSIRGKHVYATSLSLSTTGSEVCLLLMMGSGSNKTLMQHYYGNGFNKSISSLQIWPLFTFATVLKWFSSKSTWPFLSLAKSIIESASPQYLICYHVRTMKFFLRSKTSNRKYIQEVFDLPYYPSKDCKENIPYKTKTKILELREVLNNTDLVIVPTQEIFQTLHEPPYFIRIPPIKILPLASSVHRLPRKMNNLTGTIELFYLGDLHPDNGLEDLCEALINLNDVHLNIITQDKNRINSCKQMLETIVGPYSVTFHLNLSIECMRKLLQKADAFVAPFKAKTPFIYRGHASICDYVMWCRPIIAPNIPVIRNLLPKGIWQGFLYNIEDPNSLQDKLNKLRDVTYRFMISENLYDVPVDVFSNTHRTQILKRLLETCR